MHPHSYIWALLLKSVVIAEPEGKHNLGRSFVLHLLCLRSLSIFSLLFSLAISSFQPRLQMWLNLLPWTVDDEQGHQLEVFKDVSVGWGWALVFGKEKLEIMPWTVTMKVVSDCINRLENRSERLRMNKHI